MMLLRITILNLLLFSFSDILSQNFIKSVGVGGYGYDWGYAITADSEGNIYTAGIFDNYCCFSSECLVPYGCFDNYVVKFNSILEVEWVRSFGGTICDYANSIILDDEGNCYVSGSFQISADFIDTVIYASHSEFNSFIAKYDENGALIWAKEFVGERCRMCFSNNGYMYVSGNFSYPVVFGSDTIYSKGHEDGFVAKVDKSGSIIWIKQIGSIGFDYFGAICTDEKGDVYFAGIFEDTLIYNNVQYISKGGDDIFICKTGPDGNCKWVKQIGGKYDDHIRDISYSKKGLLYAIGRIKGNVYIDSIPYTGNGAFMIAQFDTSGSHNWVVQEDGYNDCQGDALGTDRYGNAYVAGAYQYEGYFGNDTLPGLGYWDYIGFFARYNRNGTLGWILHTDNTGICIPSNLYYNNDTVLYVTGMFCGYTSFGADTLLPILSNDIFISQVSIGSDYYIDPFEIEEEILLFPNPADDFFNIYINSKEYDRFDFIIVDITGKVIRERSKCCLAPVNVSTIKPGLYFIFLYSDKKIIALRKLIIE